MVFKGNDGGKGMKKGIACLLAVLMALSLFPLMGWDSMGTVEAISVSNGQWVFQETVERGGSEEGCSYLPSVDTNNNFVIQMNDGRGVVHQYNATFPGAVIPGGKRITIHVEASLPYVAQDMLGYHDDYCWLGAAIDNLSDPHELWISNWGARNLGTFKDVNNPNEHGDITTVRSYIYEDPVDPWKGSVTESRNLFWDAPFAYIYGQEMTIWLIDSYSKGACLGWKYKWEQDELVQIIGEAGSKTTVPVDTPYTGSDGRWVLQDYTVDFSDFDEVGFHSGYAHRVGGLMVYNCVMQRKDQFNEARREPDGWGFFEANWTIPDSILKPEDPIGITVNNSKLGMYGAKMGPDAYVKSGVNETGWYSDRLWGTVDSVSDRDYIYSQDETIHTNTKTLTSTVPTPWEKGDIYTIRLGMYYGAYIDYHYKWVENGPTWTPDPVEVIAPEGAQTMYRLYNPNSGEHFYTGSFGEAVDLNRIGWTYEGDAWFAPLSSGTPVYRLYNPNAGDHHYTPDVKERNHLIDVGWKSEGIGWYSDDSESMPLYRLYNPNALGAGAHHYTADKEERDNLKSIGWKDEGIGWYGFMG